MVFKVVCFCNVRVSGYQSSTSPCQRAGGLSLIVSVECTTTSSATIHVASTWAAVAVLHCTLHWNA